MDRELDEKSVRYATAAHSHIRGRDGKNFRRESNV